MKVTVDVSRSLRPEDRTCPLDGQPLRLIEAERMRPTVFTHADGTRHPDRLATLRVSTGPESAQEPFSEHGWSPLGEGK